MSSHTECVVRLDGDLKLKEVESLRRRFLEAIDGHETVEVDAGGLRGVDLAGVQLLVAAGKTAQARGRRLRFVGADKGALAEVLAAAGFGPDALQSLSNSGAA